MRHSDLQTGARNGFKARAFCVLAALSAAAFSGGCYQDRAVRQITPMPAEPVADEATQLRDFSQSVVFYHSGTVQAWPTRWYLETNPDQETRLDYVLEPLKFITQTVTLPATLVLEPPFERVYYEGDVVPPTYAAMPPLPPRPPVSRGNPYPDPLAQPKPPRVPGPPMDKRRVKMERPPTTETMPPAATLPDTTAPATAPDTAPATAPETAPAPVTNPTAPAATPVPAPQPPADPAPATPPPAPELNK
jgi:hypothetical protein